MNLGEEEFLKLNVKELRGYAREYKVKKYSIMSKEQLRNAIKNSAEGKPQNVEVSLKDLQKESKKIDKFIHDYDTINKKKFYNPKIITLNKNLKTFKDNLEEMFNIYKDRIHVLDDSSLKKTYSTYIIKDSNVNKDENHMYDDFFERNKNRILQFLSNNRGYKTTMRIEYNIEREQIDDEGKKYVERSNTFNTSRSIPNYPKSDINTIYNNMKNNLIVQIESFKSKGSGWSVSGITKCVIDLALIKPLKGKSYFKLPEYLEKKKAIINMKNDDNECFKWCITRAFNLQHNNNEKITKILKKQSEKFNWLNITFPTSIEEINIFEENNPSISINVFAYKKKEEEVYPLRVSKYIDRENNIDLLFINNEENYHYCLIKDLSRLLSSQISNHNGKKYYCRKCLSSFDDDERLIKHKEYCSNELAKIIMPDENTILEFKNYCRQMKVPFVIYADFETFIKPIDDNNNYINTESYTKKVNKHVPSSFNYYISCVDDKIFRKEPVSYIAEYEGDDVAQKFIDSLEKDIKELYKRFKYPKKIIMEDVDEDNFYYAQKCHICDENLNNDKVRDHCHLTGKYRGAAHKNCNLNYKLPKFIPVIFHNLSGYDSHLFIKKLKCVKKEDLNCIPTTEEKYISFSKKIIVDEYKKDEQTYSIYREIRFLDSFRFMNSSLDKLSKNLNEEQFKNLSKYFNKHQLKLLTKKGVYPYEYMDSFKKFDETELPKRKLFFSSKTNQHITRAEYRHAKNVWDKFNIKNMREYTDLYNLTDVLILSDIFENFRNICNKTYKLDPLWYYTTPGLSFDAALKKTKVKLELLSDYDMVLFFQNGIKGGISMISNRYSKSNNKYMYKLYNPRKPSKFIIDLDANNLYGWAMSQYLPINGFKWMNIEELNNWNNLLEIEGKGCVLEVDLEYPKELHDLHNDYPLAPERITTDKSKIEKLIPNLNDKKNYIIHYKNLQLYLSLGLKLTKIHRGIIFNESLWLKEYIEMNTNLRKQAKNEFEKDFFKLMNNAVYGKTMENIENRIDVKLITDEIKAQKLNSKPNFKSSVKFDENLTAVHMHKTKVEYNKPIYLGFSILEISKTLMYDFHYNYIKNKYNNKVKLLFTDTDSLTYEIETDDFYKDIENDIYEKFDTSDYPDYHPAKLPKVNKKVIGMFGDVSKGYQILEFVGLRAKLYSMLISKSLSQAEYETEHLSHYIETIRNLFEIYEDYEDDRTECDIDSNNIEIRDEEKRCKGVCQSVVKNTITHEDYVKCLETRTKQMRKMNVFRSRKHEIFSEEVNKSALSANDDKRIILEDGRTTLAHGHYRTKEWPTIFVEEIKKQKKKKI